MAALSCPRRGSSVLSSMMASSILPVKLASACCCKCTSSLSTFCPSMRSRISRIIISRACSISDFTYSRRSFPRPLSSSDRASTSSAKDRSSASTFAAPPAFNVAFSCHKRGSSSAMRCLSSFTSSSSASSPELLVRGVRAPGVQRISGSLLTVGRLLGDLSRCAPGDCRSAIFSGMSDPGPLEHCLCGTTAAEPLKPWVVGVGTGRKVGPAVGPPGPAGVLLTLAGAACWG
mmetsp:Transcript_14797/g.40895  ORF Transcript_14797/g.40895 Transcript_14797/m.40895 type:complete len:232 (+) Transcript_14797:1314-2009(+)